MKLFLFFYLYQCVNALQFMNNKKFVPNKDKKKDIILMNKQNVNIIARNWLHSIDVYCNIDINFNKREELYASTVDTINKFEGYIQENNKGIYLVWQPKNIMNRLEEPLFIIVCEKNNDTYTIKHLIQSPFWYCQYIDSVHLKNSLEEYTNYNINLNPLYESDIKYRLSWKTWYIENQ